MPRNIKLQNNLYKLLLALPSDIKHNTYIVGGFVRDQIMNRPSNDIDIVIEKDNGSFEFTTYLKSIFKDNITDPIRMGNYPIWKIIFKEDIEYNGIHYNVKDEELECADTMQETFPNKDTRQRTTKFGTLKQDILRRDFTINQFIICLNTNKIIAPFEDAYKDFENKIIDTNPAVNPDVIFSDDPLRMIRAIRQSIQLNYKISDKIKQSIKKNAHRIEIISKERLYKELLKIVVIEQGLYNYIKMLDELDLLKYVFHTVHEKKFVKQGPDSRKIHMESDNVFGHILEVLKHTKPGIINGLAALYHDCGKLIPEKIDGKYRFLQHDKEGAKLVPYILKYHKIPNDIIKTVTLLVKYHMSLVGREVYHTKALRKIIRKVGVDNLEYLYDLVEADSAGTLQKPYDFGDIIQTPCIVKELKPYIDDLITEMNKEPKKDLLNGNDIMKLLDIKPSKTISEVKDFIQDQLDENPKLTKQEAEDMVMIKFYHEPKAMHDFWMEEQLQDARWDQLMWDSDK